MHLQARLVFLVFLLAVLPASGIRAQIPVRFGLCGGWSSTKWINDSRYLPDDFFESKNGYQVGLVLDGHLTGTLGLRTELLYVRKGASVEGTAVDENGEALGRVTEYFNADYVQIPVLLSVDLIRGPNNPRPRFFLGPTVGLNVSARWKYDSEEVDPALFQETQGDLDHVKSLEVGLLLGGGIDFRAGAHVLQLQIRYEVGLTDAFGTARNRGLTLMTGYSF